MKIGGIMKEAKLFSFAITSYNNYKYIREAVDSVLMQDYPCVQLIFSNDGSADFNAEELSDYVEGRKGQNIVDVQIYTHEENQGTVRNVEFCRSKADGEYIMYMAADDALNGADVLSRYVAEFDKLGEDALVLCSKVAMCGESLGDIEGYEPSAEGIRAIRDGSPKELFSRMSHTWTIPTTTCCYRREIYDVVGGYDTDYFIMEDGPLFMKLARNGQRIYWVDDLVAARHRGGGISHGNTLNLSESYRKYRYDEIIFFEKEVLPFRDQLLEEDKKPMQSKWEYIQRAYFETFVMPNMSRRELLAYQIKHFPQYARGVLRRTKEKAVGWIEDTYLNKNLFFIGIVFAVVYLLPLLLPIPISAETKMRVMNTAGVMAVAFCGFALFLRIMRIVRHLWLTVKYIFTGRG